MRSLTVLAALAVSSAAFAAPVQISHQGRLTDADGAALEGEQTLTFSLYDAENGGNQAWTESQTLNLTGGYFSAKLGAVSPLDDSTFGGTLYLETTVGSETLPRLAILPVPMAVKAWSVSGGSVDASEVKVGGNTIIGADGKIDFGAISNAPADADTFGDLACNTGDVPLYDGSTWTCEPIGGGEIDAADITSGTLAIERLPVGTTTGTVLAGDSTFDAAVITSGTLAFERLPVGTGANQVMPGNKTFTAADVGALPIGGGTLTGPLTVGGSVKIGASTATCDTGAVGTLRQATAGLQVCLAGGWATITTNNGSGTSMANAARSCLAIKTDYPSSADGMFWLDPNGGSLHDAVRSTCDMTTDGGGWTLAAKVTDDYGWIDTGDWGNLFHPNNETTSLTNARDVGVGGGVHLPNDQIKGAFSSGRSQVRFAFWDNAISNTQASDDAFATLRGQAAADFFDDTKLVDARLAAGHYTWTKIRHTKSVKPFNGGIVCWSNRNGQSYRGYEHGLFMGNDPASGCHLFNDANAIQMKAHYGGNNGTQWYLPNACGAGKHGHSMLGTCQPLQVTYSAIYVWVR